MAERYSMMPNGFPPGIPQQHTQQMGQNHLQQLQQDSHPPVPGFPDNGPMWNQMQQMQNQFRPQSAGMDGAHVNPQVAELMRSQLAARQNQQQQQQQQQQQFGMQQMQGQPTPQQFLDPSNQQQQPSQSHPGFQNPSLQTLNNRTAMLFQQPNNPAAHRQLELMGLAHNQQPQNGPINFANRMQHQQGALGGQPGMGQPQQPENFLSPSLQNSEGMRRPSPSQQSAQPAPQPGQPPHVTRASYIALTERANNLKNIITNQESQLVQLTSQRTRIGDATFMDKVRTVSADLKNRKEHYNRLLNFIHQLGAQLQANGQMNNPMGGGGGGMPPQQNAGGQQPSWMQAGPSQPQPSFNQNGQPQNGQPGGPQAHPTNGHLQNHAAVPPRTGQTPHQFPNGMQPNPPFQQNPGAGQEGRHFPPIPPLEKGRFDTVYKSFCTQRNLVHNPRMMSIEARPLELYDLHTQVMLEGGGTNVAQKDLWAVIGGRMGFVQFPGTDTEPAKSGPGVAQHLAHAYKEYLAAFDNVYVSTVMDSRRKNDAMTIAQRGQMALGGNVPPQILMRPGGALTDPQQMQLVMAYANLPLSELRRLRVSEALIQFIENNRTTLIRNATEQGIFRNQIPRLEQNGPMHSGGPQFAGSPPSGPMGNGMINPGQPPFMRPGMQHGQMENGQQPPQHPGQPQLARPSREHLQAAMAHITKLKSDYSPERMLQNVPPIEVPAEQRMEYNTVLEQLHRSCVDLDQKLPMLFAVLKKEDVVRRLVIIVQTAIQQRAMISSGSTRFLVTLDTLRTMLQQVQHMNDSFATILASLVGKGLNMPPGGGPSGMPPQLRPPGQNLPGPSALPINQQQPIQPPPPANSLPPQQQPPNRPLDLRPPPRKRVPNAPSPTPPPVASASTPVHNAPTPTRDMASPKSPKTKPKAKPAPKRRASVKTAAPPSIPPPEPATASAPSPNGNKRPRPEESSPPHQSHASPSNAPSNAPGPSVANGPSPPKRIKVEWEGPPNPAITARAEQVENVKTEEDSAAFLEQMTELFKMAGGNDGQELTSDFSETLDTIFKGFGASTDEGASGMSSLGVGDGSAPQDSAPPVVDEFEFFDFSSFGEEDDTGSKAETPDLVSSTNPSPESGSEVDAAHALTSTDVKSEDFSNDLRLGVWKEVDGGESAYFQAGQWKWDTPMQSLDQPWAIFNS
ncbi:hypothetical protein B0H16DRAFT_1363068 [Mycena metata]|uniref:ARID domain-containing protein n=1 Tax=Mycena metata TaxID=1033252 RepID=A0AAD7NRX8_9AGAR|nr:hypothetical protein B0H16DRAFT_1363068 [Mycena metata]